MIHVTVYNLSVAVQTDERKLIDIIEDFLKKNYTIKTPAYSGAIQPPDKRFVSKLSKHPVYYLHINQFRHLLYILKEANYDLRELVRVDEREYEIDSGGYTVREGWVLREDQEGISDFITIDPTGTKLVSLQTGKGKTFVALHSLAKVNMRIGVVILPGFIDKWTKDIVTIHEAQAMDVMVIQGSKSIKSIIQMAKEGTLSAKYFIFSSRTMQEYISDYEENTEDHLEVYGIHPVQLFPLLKIGSLLIDETHMQFHAIFKIILHCNVKLQVGLSATLISDDSVVSRVHRIVYPEKTVYDPGELDRYTDVYALGYSVPADLLRQVKTTNYGSKSYSHTAFEQSVMRSPPLKRFYYSLIDNAMKDYYTSQYEAKDKCLIFVATIKMATELTQRYEQLYPEKVVRRYCEDDPFENVNEGEIIVSTVLSAGTAIDISNLRVVVQTVSISSSVSNIQTLGRLRKLKDGKDTRFCYLFADNLPKQKQYHYRRIELFRTRVASHRTFKARASY